MPPIPSDLLEVITAFLADVKAGRYNHGGQLLLNVSPQGIITSVEVKARIEHRNRPR